jgi:antibiotic biosynthesis monooxygenase (ABM) superfamily enzyme
MITFSEYSNTAGGLGREERFNEFLPRATSTVDYWLTSEVTTEHYDTYVTCVSELIDLMDSPETHMGSASIVGDSDYTPRAMKEIIIRHLGKTGLIYQGV